MRDYWSGWSAWRKIKDEKRSIETSRNRSRCLNHGSRSVDVRRLQRVKSIFLCFFVVFFFVYSHP
jgi:hypothetical protein